MDTGVPQGIFSQPAPTPVQILSRNYGYGIPAQMGTGSKGTHGNGNPCGIGPRVDSEMYIATI
jgi:hypothetical protein